MQLQKEAHEKSQEVQVRQKQLRELKIAFDSAQKAFDIKNQPKLLKATTSVKTIDMRSLKSADQDPFKAIQSSE